MAKEKKEKEVKEKKLKSSGKGEKFADMSATAVVIDETELEKQLQEEAVPRAVPETAPAKTKTLRVRGKKYLERKKMIDKNKVYPIQEAIELLKKISDTKFTQTVEIHLNVLEKGLSGEVKLPHFEGKAQNVVIFEESMVDDIKAGKINFDVLLATPADMPKILPLAKVLGPKGKMPNPKNGTVSPDPKKTLEKFSGSALRYKTEKDFPLIHTVIGLLNQPVEELIANFESLIKSVNPKNITKAIVKSTMSPSLKVSL